jgi:hypothetical protein
MKTKAALALSLTGILLTGSAAIAANAQTLNSSQPGISDDVKNVLVTDDSATRTAPAPARVVPKAAPKAVTQTSDGKKADDKKASAARKAARPAEPGDDNGGKRTTPEPGDDNAGLATAQTFTGSGSSSTTVTAEPGDDNGGFRTTPEPGDDNGGLRSAQAPRAAAQAGDDKGGTRKAPEPGDDSGGHGGHGSDD